jgi:hypothetical protein
MPILARAYRGLTRMRAPTCLVGLIVIAPSAFVGIFSKRPHCHSLQEFLDRRFVMKRRGKSSEALLVYPDEK